MLPRILTAFLLFSLVAPLSAQAPGPRRVAMVLPQQDFYYPDYGPLRDALEAQGATVTVAAPSLAPCYPHAGTAQGAANGGVVVPDIALTDVSGAEFDAIVVTGGWGVASVTFAFPGTWLNPAYGPDTAAALALNTLFGEFLAEDKPVAAICHGVSVLAWARVDGTSPLDGATVTGYAGNGPAASVGGQTYAANTLPTRWHVEQNGATMLSDSAIGDPTSAHDDVIVDGNLVTAQDWRAASALGATLVSEIDARHIVPTDGTNDDSSDDASDDDNDASNDDANSDDDASNDDANTDDPADEHRVLMVIANYHFYYREYAEPRAELLEEGIAVDIAAGRLETCYPHAGSGYSDADGAVEPDLTVADALALATSDPERWDAIVFVGGWGSSAYQYAYPGTYANGSYNGEASIKADVNALINAFDAQGKYVTALCHGVSVLAYARVQGVSPLAGRTVVAWPYQAPPELVTWGQTQRRTHDLIAAEGAFVLAPGSVGDTTSSSDDVWIDGNIITGESFDSARAFGEVLAEQITQP